MRAGQINREFHFNERGYSGIHCNCTMVAPPLTVTKAEVDEGMTALDGALTAFEATL